MRQRDDAITVHSDSTVRSPYQRDARLLSWRALLTGTMPQRRLLPCFLECRRLIPRVSDSIRPPSQAMEDRPIAALIQGCAAVEVMIVVGVGFLLRPVPCTDLVLGRAVNAVQFELFVP